MMSSGPSPTLARNSVPSASGGAVSKSSTLGTRTEEAPVRQARSSWANELIVTCCTEGNVGGKAKLRKSSTALTEKRGRSQ